MASLKCAFSPFISNAHLCHIFVLPFLSSSLLLASQISYYLYSSTSSFISTKVMFCLFGKFFFLQKNFFSLLCNKIRFCKHFSTMASSKYAIKEKNHNMLCFQIQSIYLYFYSIKESKLEVFVLWKIEQFRRLFYK